MSFLQLVLLLDKTIEGINSILPIVSYRNRYHQSNGLTNGGVFNIELSCVLNRCYEYMLESARLALGSLLADFGRSDGGGGGRCPGVEAPVQSLPILILELLIG